MQCVNFFRSEFGSMSEYVNFLEDYILLIF